MEADTMLTERGPIGPHVSPPLAGIPEALVAGGWRIFQTYLRDPRRLSKEGIPDEADRLAFRERSAGLWGIAHGSMLINLASPDPRTRNGSVSALAADANLAAEIGIAAVCFHVGYQKGHDDRDAAHAEVARKLRDVVAKLKPGARVLLENGCEGTELGQTIAEVARVVELAEVAPDRVGVVIDTCHLHVAGFDLAAGGAADELDDQIDAGGLWPYMTCLHLNDAQFPCGSRRDRHAPPGEGTIGDGLRRIRGHARLGSLPALLEINVEGALRATAYLES